MVILTDGILLRGFRDFLIPFAPVFRHRAGVDNKRGLSLWSAALMLCLASSALAENLPVKIDVDATDAARGILHARLNIPAAPGELTLYYPKWIPEEHMPSGPINNMTGLKFFAQGQPLDWRRDADDMCTFHVTVPAHAAAVEVTLDFLLNSTGGVYSSSGSATAKLLDLNWNQVLLYPNAPAPLKIPFVASVRLPAGWQFGTALPIAKTNGDTVGFSAAPLETLIDSPVIAGEFFRAIDLTPGENPPQALDIVADSAAALDIAPEDIGHFTRLVREENALFGAHHYRDYHFLLTLSDRVGHFGLEHHESSDDRTAEDFLTNPDTRLLGASLLPHEMVHSWNGKFRRPAGLATPDYQQPMEDELLWVYEGLTDYYGEVLAARSGLQSSTNFTEVIAAKAAMLDHREGREWRSLADTAISAPILYNAPSSNVSRRRRVDFYPEGDLIWLEADTLIRTQTHGKKSLDDFCKQFHGGESGAPRVVPYTYAMVVAGLNAVAPYDWNNFFQQRIYTVTPHAPLGGIENGGWHLVYTNTLPHLAKLMEAQHKTTDLSYSLGFAVGSDGSLGDVLPGSPADQAGMATGMKLVAVNTRAWTADILRTAVKNAVTNSAPIELLVQNGDYFKTCLVNYHEGEKYPVLERMADRPDLLAQILRPGVSPGPAADSAN